MRYLIPFILLFLRLSHSIAQTTSFLNYNMENGLSQNQVQTICQDNNGNLWVGTISGLSRYDGTHFLSFSKSQGLAEDWISASCKDRSGNLWFGHWAGSISRYNQKTQAFENLHLEEQLRFQTVQKLFADEQNNIWIATQGAGMFIYNSTLKKLISFGPGKGLSGSMVFDFTFDHSNNCWVSSDKGLSCYTFSPGNASEPRCLTFSAKEGLFSEQLTAIHCNALHELWIGSADKGIAVLPLNQLTDINKPELFLKNQYLFSKNSLGVTKPVKCFYEDSQQNMWIGTVGDGAFVFSYDAGLRGKSRLTNGLFKTYSTRQGLTYFNVNTFFEDREHSLWIGTDLGLNLYRGERFQIYDEADQLPNNIVWATCVDHLNNIWLGTNEGLSRLNAPGSSTASNSSAKNSERKIVSFTEKEGLLAKTILSCFEDSRHTLWLGTAGGGVFYKKSGSPVFERFTTANGIPDNTVYTIAEDKDGNIWLGTKAGAACFNTIKNQFQLYNSENGLSGDHIYRIYKDTRNILWIAALGGDLCSYDGLTFKQYNVQHGLKHQFILSMNADRLGNLWLGAYGGGLYKYDGKKFINFSSKDGMKTLSPFSVVADKEGNIWMGNNQGIEKFDTKKNQFIHYGKAEGFLGSECNPNASCIDLQGNIWFGTIMGALRFNPREDLPNKISPVISLQGIKINQKVTAFPADGEFAHDQNHIGFNFSGVCLSNPEKLVYEYTLDGFDHGWIQASSKVHEAIYTHLPPGEYTFKVKARNNSGVWSEPVSYFFTVKPAFWQTALFYVSALLFVVFAVYLYDKIRTGKLKQSKQELEQKVEERTLQLALKNEELAIRNKDMTDSIIYAKRIQESYLNNLALLHELLPDAFVFNKAKDIVSGDFCWARKKNGYIYLAVVDCTGHGVPGAVLSLVARSILDKTLDECSSTDPASLLNHLNSLAEQTLQSTSGQLQVRDGMDISLCRIDYTAGKIDYAGAYHPLYFVTQAGLVTCEADQLSIGRKQTKKSYNRHTLSFKKGNMLYLFSDGFIDQPGGDGHQKFGANRLQDLLVQLHSQPIYVQHHELEKAFQSWKGNLEQLDDVMIVGIKLSDPIKTEIDILQQVARLQHKNHPSIN